MAYRHAVALAFVTFGLVAVACGGGNASSAAPGDGEDLPPRSSDQPPPSPDQPPANPDRPAGSPGAPGGGGGNSDAEAACRAFCDKVGGDCPGAGANAVARAICEDDCEITPDIAPCVTQAVALITCLSGLSGLCTEDGPPDSAAQGCQSALDALGECTDPDTGNPDTGNPDTGNDPPGGGGGDCSEANDCAGCTDTCDACRCTLGEDNSACDIIC